MLPTGHHLIAGTRSADSAPSLRAVDPHTGLALDPGFPEATSAEIHRAMDEAQAAFLADYGRPHVERAGLLDRVADEIEGLGEVLVTRVMQETGLPAGRVRGERGRTVNQLRLFGDLLRSGTWPPEHRTPALPDRSPAPRPEIRRRLIPLGPVVVFGASNFPLAFSVAGGDTASALAAGCPVVVKAHPAHPGTSELVGRAIMQAVDAAGFHQGTFSLLHASAPERSIELVSHPLACAVGFTGSTVAGRALFDAAARRLNPIPVYAEMGSTNPVFVLPSAQHKETAAGFVASLTLGVGQFCTNPGLVVLPPSTRRDAFLDAVQSGTEQAGAGTMLHAGIRASYERRLAEIDALEGVERLATGREGTGSATPAQTVVFRTDADTFLAHPTLREEIFGPASLIVTCETGEHVQNVAAAVAGNLTATLHGTEDELLEHLDLIRLLERKVGRLSVGGFPTGVEVCEAMQHGGPYPATTDVRSTSVGTAAIERFVRPIAYQNVPASLLG